MAVGMKGVGKKSLKMLASDDNVDEKFKTPRKKTQKTAEYQKSDGKKSVSEKSVGKKGVGRKSVGKEDIGKKGVGKSVGKKGVGRKSFMTEAIGQKGIGKGVGNKGVHKKGKWDIGDCAMEFRETMKALVDASVFVQDNDEDADHDTVMHELANNVANSFMWDYQRMRTRISPDGGMRLWWGRA